MGTMIVVHEPGETVYALNADGVLRAWVVDADGTLVECVVADRLAVERGEA